MPVFEVILQPEDGLYPCRTWRGRRTEPWEDDGVQPVRARAECGSRSTRTASRIVEEIDRFGVGDEG